MLRREKATRTILDLEVRASNPNLRRKQLIRHKSMASMIHFGSFDMKLKGVTTDKKLRQRSEPRNKIHSLKMLMVKPIVTLPKNK